MNMMCRIILLVHLASYLHVTPSPWCGAMLESKEVWQVYTFNFKLHITDFQLSGACAIYCQLNHMPCDFYSFSISLIARKKPLAAFCWLFRHPYISIIFFPWRWRTECSRNNITSLVILERGALACALSCYQGLNYQSIKVVAKCWEKIQLLRNTLVTNQIFKCSSGKSGFQSKSTAAFNLPNDFPRHLNNEKLLCLH